MGKRIANLNQISRGIAVSYILNEKPRLAGRGQGSCRMESIAESAKKYYGMGLSLIPIRAGTKRPAIPRWKPFQDRRPDDEQVRQWWDGTDHGIAAIMGRVSGDLVCRDFDRAESYEQWRDSYPNLAKTLPTVETARGAHVYARLDSEQISQASRTGSSIIGLGDGELRGGGYCLLPPSVHPTGQHYRWSVPLVKMPPRLTLENTGFLSDRTHAMCLLVSDGSEGGRDVDIRDAIAQTLPDGPGLRNRKVFDFARRLKSIMPSAESPQLRPIVQRWHSEALPSIRTKGFTDTWVDFVIAWGRVEISHGADFEAIIAEARESQTPAAGRMYDDETMRFLVRICAALQHYHGTEPFYLSCRTAARILGLKKTQANMLLRTLEFDGIIQHTTAGTRKSKRASEYIYLGSGKDKR